MRSYDILPILIAIGLIAAGCSSAQPIVEGATLGCKTIVFSYSVHGRSGFESNIVSTCPDGGNKGRLTIDGQGNVAPVWSPDGREVAFISDRSGSQQLYVMAADGGNVRQLTSGLEIGGYEWLPSSDHIALRILLDGSWGWAAVSTATKGISPLEWQLATSISVAELSHDSGRVAYVQPVHPPQVAVPSQIRIQNTDGSNDFALTDDSWSNYNPVWSSDDSQLAFLTNRDGVEGKFAIYAVSADGSDLRALTEPIFGEGAFFSWSPDGDSVAVFSDDTIYVMDLHSGNMTKLFTVDYPNYVSNFSWRP